MQTNQHTNKQASKQLIKQRNKPANKQTRKRACFRFASSRDCMFAFILAYLVKYFNTDASNKEGYVFFKSENLTAYMFMSVVVALFLGLTVSAEEIIRDRKIRKRESFLNLSKGSYLWSKIIIMFTY